MADLMSDTYQYDSLANQYGNFRLPAVKIFIDGTDVLASMGLLLKEIQVVLSLSAASSARFKLGNVYDRKKRCFQAGLPQKFKPGTIVEIAMGYYSSTTRMMKGFVYMLGCEFGAEKLLVVTVMDVRRLMMVSGTRRVLHNAKKYSEVFQTVMSGYARLCRTEVTATEDALESPVSQNGTDYDFVMKELVKKGKSDREFLVVYDKAYFRPKPESGAAIMKVELGRELLEMQMDYTYLDMEIQVLGMNPYEQTVYVGKAAARSEDPQISLLSPTPVRMISDPDAGSQEKAGRRAGWIAKTEKERSRSARLVLIGLPELVPGRFIEVAKVESMVNRSYYISEVRHQIGEEVFTSEIVC